MEVIAVGCCLSHSLKACLSAMNYWNVKCTGTSVSTTLPTLSLGAPPSTRRSIFQQDMPRWTRKEWFMGSVDYLTWRLKYSTPAPAFQTHSHTLKETHYSGFLHFYNHYWLMVCKCGGGDGMCNWTDPLLRVEGWSWKVAALCSPAKSQNVDWQSNGTIFRAWLFNQSHEAVGCAVIWRQSMAYPLTRILGMENKGTTWGRGTSEIVLYFTKVSITLVCCNAAISRNYIDSVSLLWWSKTWCGV